MPWTTEDVKDHNKEAAKDPQKAKQWVKVANKVLKETGSEATAIKEANAAVSRHLPFNAFDVATRFADVKPSSYDKDTRSVEAVISLGSPVERWFGIEKLRISASAVDLSRMQSSGIPLLDSHQQSGINNHLGRFVSTRFGKVEGKNALLGQAVFNDTPRGREAEGMVSRGEIKGISAGYLVKEWEITDKDGRVIDPEVERLRFDEPLTFEAKRWELLEASLVSVPADAPSMIRSLEFGTGEDRVLPRLGGSEVKTGYTRIVARNGSVIIDSDGTVTFEGQPEIKVESRKHNEEARARMQARQRMIDRMRE